MKNIIDVSSVIYAGHYGNDRRLRGFPIGGIRRLFGIIAAGLSYGDFVLCFDGGSILKKELLPEYKAGRIPNYSVIAQIDLLKELLLKCDIPFYCDPRYEADDYVYSVCSELDILGDTEAVTIYTDDRDLSCCVTDNNSVRNVSTNGTCINRENYEEKVIRGKVIPYNTILLWKLFHGDSSDNYKALRIPGISFESVAQFFIGSIDPLIGDGGLSSLAYADYKVFEILISEYEGTLAPEDFKVLKSQARIAYPYKIEVSDTDIEGYRIDSSKGDPLHILERKHMKFFGNGNFNRSKFENYCSLMGLYRTVPSKSVDRESAMAQEFYRLLEMRAAELASGAMAVEKYRNRPIEKPYTQPVANMDLPL